MPAKSLQSCPTLCNATRQAPLFTGLSRQEYWSGLPCLPPEGLPNPETESTFLVSPAAVVYPQLKMVCFLLSLYTADFEQCQ